MPASAPRSSACAEKTISRAVFFDLDRTLIDCNSGTLWVAEEWRGGQLSVADVVWAGWWLTRYHLGMADGLAQVYETAVARIAGQAEADMIEHVQRWFPRDVAPRLRPGAKIALADHHQVGDRVVLATSSSPYAGGAACDAFGIDELISTRFEVVDGHFTGKISAPALGAAKADRVREWAQSHGVNLSRCTFYSDSHTDLALLEAVGEPVAVNPDRMLARVAAERGWKVLDWGTSSGTD